MVINSDVGGFPGTWLDDFPRNIGNWIIIPMNELIFFRGGWNHQPDYSRSRISSNSRFTHKKMVQNWAPSGKCLKKNDEKSPCFRWENSRTFYCAIKIQVRKVYHSHFQRLPFSGGFSHGFPMVPPGHLSAGQVHAPKVGVQRGLVPVMERIWGRAAVGGCESLGYGAGDPNVWPYPLVMTVK